MSISVLSITAQAPAVNLSAVPLNGDLPLSSNGLPIDFAALLGGQLAQLPQSGVTAFQGYPGANSADNKGTNLASFSPDQWQGIRAAKAPAPTDQGLITATPLAAQAGTLDSLATLVDRQLRDTNHAEKSPGKVVEQANQNAHFLRGQASEPNADSLLIATTKANPQSVEGVLALIAPQKKMEQAKSRRGSEEILATIDPALVAQTLPLYPPPLLENHGLIDVDRNKQPSLASLSDALPADESLLLPYQNTPLENRRPIDVERNKQPSLTSLSDALPADESLLPPYPNPPLENRGIIDVDRSKQPSFAGLSDVLPADESLLLPYPNAPLENRRPIDVDRNRQPSPASLSDAPSADERRLPPQSSLDSKSASANNPSASLAQSIVTPIANADTANLAAPSASTGNSAPPAFASLMVSHTQNTSQAPVAASTPTIATTLQDSRWPQEFSDRIVWIAKNDQQVAQINITPAQLGPVQITVNINGDQASINFASPHAEVRKAIEDAMPNLREMLASSGISLGQSNVGSQLQQQQRELPGQFANGSRSTGENAILPPDSRTGSNSSSLPIQRGRGLVDLFA